MGSKQQLWEAEVIDPESRLIVERAQGERNEALLKRLLEGAQHRLCYPHGVVLFSDGEPSYQTLFPEVFGVPYRPARSKQRGRFPKLRYCIARTQAHVQIVKQRLGKRIVNVAMPPPGGWTLQASVSPSPLLAPLKPVMLGAAGA